MAHIVAIRNGMSASDEKDLSNLAVAFLSSGGGVVGGGDYLVAAQSSPNNTVQIATGRAYVPTSDGSMVYSTHLDASQNVTIGANSSGNNRIDCIVLYIDLSVSPDAAADNVAKFYDVQGTPAGSPVAPNNAAILSAIGSSNPYIILAQVSVVNGFTSINSGNITDQRAFAKISGGDTTFQAAFSNFVKSGLVMTAPGASLTMTIPSGVMYINGVNVAVNSDGGHTYTASQDTYVDVTSGGAYVYTGVTNNAAAPALTSNAIRVGKVISNGTQITSVVQTGFDSNNVPLYPATPLVGLHYRQPYVSGIYDNGTTGGSVTVDWSKGDHQKITISSAITLAYSNAKVGQVLKLYLYENATGNFAITLPTSKWPGGSAGTFTITANAKNLLIVDYDGTDYLTQLAAGFA